MSEQDEQQTHDDEAPTQAGGDGGGDGQADVTAFATQIADLREMQKSGDHLNETIEDARDAVQAAHNANTMGSSGESEDHTQEPAEANTTAGQEEPNEVTN